MRYCTCNITITPANTHTTNVHTHYLLLEESWHAQNAEETQEETQEQTQEETLLENPFPRNAEETQEETHKRNAEETIVR